MTPDSAVILLARAMRQVDDGRCSCHITADQLAELATCYACLWNRMEKVEELAGRALLAWSDHHREAERCLVGQIQETCRCA